MEHIHNQFGAQIYKILSVIVVKYIFFVTFMYFLSVTTGYTLILLLNSGKNLWHSMKSIYNERFWRSGKRSIKVVRNLGERFIVNCLGGAMVACLRSAVFEVTASIPKSD